MTVHDFSITLPDGGTRPLSDYAGRPVLLVNVASRCGMTPQYAGLEELARDGVVQVIGFPCNQFGGQEPGTDEEIATFCSATYGVTFPVTTKIEVNGPDADPLWVHLRQQAPGSGPDDVRWNFTKFLIAPDGTVTRRYEPQETPDRIAADLATAG